MEQGVFLLNLVVLLLDELVLLLAFVVADHDLGVVFLDLGKDLILDAHGVDDVGDGGRHDKAAYNKLFIV